MGYYKEKIKTILLVLTLIFGIGNIVSQTIALMPSDGSWYTWNVDDGILYDDGNAGNSYSNNKSGKLTIYPLNQSSFLWKEYYLCLLSYQ